MKMKRYFWMMAAAVFGLVACQNELEEVRLVDPSQVVAPVLHELPSEIVITAENMSETVKFEWDKADFGQGAAWAAMLALPFTLLTNSLNGEHMGSYLGLFNCTICLPQIVAAALGGLVLKAVGGVQANMLIIAGILLVLGAVCVYFVTEKKQK